ncbi:MAG: hypothetical protein GDA55_08465 [Cellvibrionales bacterium]|nr:hypothetical protein [Cellvibrionales bacterium]
MSKSILHWLPATLCLTLSLALTPVALAKRADGGPMEGTDTADTLNGTTNNDLINGRGGDDTISGGKGQDRLRGNRGNDTLRGDRAKDKLRGGPGDDMLYGGAQNDFLWGGAGDDTLRGGTHNDALYGGTGDDRLVGGPGHDRLFGDEDDDILKGWRGNDRLMGGSGDDRLKGGKGDDILNGGEDKDTLVGDEGNDQFHLLDPEANAADADRVNDFRPADDVLVLPDGVTEVSYFQTRPARKRTRSTILQSADGSQTYAALRGHHDLANTATVRAEAIQDSSENNITTRTLRQPTLTLTRVEGSGNESRTVTADDDGNNNAATVDEAAAGSNQTNLFLTSSTRPATPAIFRAFFSGEGVTFVAGTPTDDNWGGAAINPDDLSATALTVDKDNAYVDFTIPSDSDCNPCQLLRIIAPTETGVHQDADDDDEAIRIAIRPRNDAARNYDRNPNRYTITFDDDE